MRLPGAISAFALALLSLACLTFSAFSAPPNILILFADDMKHHDLKTDLAEQTNLAEKQPEKVASLKKLLQSAITRGRTTPGPNQSNDRKVSMNDPKAPSLT